MKYKTCDFCGADLRASNRSGLCAKCRDENPMEVKKRLFPKCPSCGRPMQWGARFCKGCSGPSRVAERMFKRGGK